MCMSDGHGHGHRFGSRSSRGAVTYEDSNHVEINVDMGTGFRHGYHHTDRNYHNNDNGMYIF